MLNRIDAARLEFVIKTGRRFYTAVELLRKYCISLRMPRYVNLHMNNISNRRSEYDFIFNVGNDDNSFDSMTIYSDEFDDDDSDENEDFEENEEDSLDYFHFYEYDGLPLTRTHELFRCFGDKLFINRYTNLNYSEFRNKYHDEYSREVADMFYAATTSIVPLEINNDSVDIPCIYGGSTFLPNDRFSLIDALYRSDKAIDFINGFISLIMTSSILFMDISTRTSWSLNNSKSVRCLYDHYNKSWKSDIYNLNKFFSKP